ncbi:adenosine deaminase [Promicromonospora thailandica]|uniref:Adenine deaminase n=1 Tax=Promicromonospora thailandica TaxID=765201 RepID=A0A9X2JUV2_9MICO|nr:adenosine deaminase [Promicromonospora thailandica]MCP2263882.1 adenosine deaminase [Promicromonospora thailandica]BFF17809.1 adenosine deaminase [Promicromonospora thailandica]
MTSSAPPSRPPRAELHVHLEGTLEPELAFELAARNGVRLPYDGPDALRAAYDFADLGSFLELYTANMAVLRTAADFADLTRAYLRRAARAGVRHAEITVDPQAHLARGVPLEDVVDGVAEVLARSEPDHGISTLLVAAFHRDEPAAGALEVLDRLLAMDAPIVGIGLDNAETGYPPGLFTDLYARAEAAGLRRTAHAGEEGPASNVRDALDLLHAERIDHGIAVVQDPDLLARVAAEQVPFTVCPVSNVRLRAVPSLAEHPLPAMMAAGMLVSVHSDDPPYFDAYVDDVDDAVTAAFGHTRDQRAALAAASFRGSFLPPDRAAAHLADVEAWRTGG